MAEKINGTHRKIAADMCSYVNSDGNSLHIEFTIPGVNKDNIKLRLQEDSFSLSAIRKEIEYVSTGSFCCPVKTEKTNAIYENGLLAIDIPFKDPWEGAHEVTIN